MDSDDRRAAVRDVLEFAALTDSTAPRRREFSSPENFVSVPEPEQ